MLVSAQICHCSSGLNGATVCAHVKIYFFKKKYTIKSNDRYTFPTETKFANIALARDVYTRVTRATLRCGTTTCCYFATIHADATMLFADILSELGQRAFVGKVCMDRNAPPTYVEASAEVSVADSERVIKHIHALARPTVCPVIPNCFATVTK